MKSSIFTKEEQIYHLVNKDDTTAGFIRCHLDYISFRGILADWWQGIFNGEEPTPILFYNRIHHEDETAVFVMPQVVKWE